MDVQLQESFRLPLIQHISSHCWSSDRSLLAICPNTNELLIFQRGSSGAWTLLHALSVHTQKISCIDWSTVTSDNNATIHRIVTCSEDRNAYVWTMSDFDLKTIKHEMVVVRLDAGATIVRWSPSGKKFAIGSVSCNTPLSICYYDSGAKWWTCRMVTPEELKNINWDPTGILALSWHPNSVLLGIGTLDSIVIVLSAYIKDLDTKPSDSQAWGSRLPFGTICMALKRKTQSHRGWINSLSFSPDGNFIATTDCNSEICIFQPSKNDALVLKGLNMLPFLSLLWIYPTLIVVSGFSGRQVVYSKNTAGSWLLLLLFFIHRELVVEDRNTISEEDPKEKSISSMAFSKFKSLILTGEDVNYNDTRKGEDTASRHNSTVNELKILKENEYSSSSIDGVICSWRLISTSKNISSSQPVADNYEEYDNLSLNAEF